MNVLSLFDGISCARIALEKAGIEVSNYYASEIDKYAIQVAKYNFPSTIHLGDIRNIDISDLPKIDLLIGGSPCQDLSQAQKGLGLQGEKSSLFYEYIRLLKELKPTYFLLENVKNKWGNLMSEYAGVNFIEINSGLFSAQSRPRYYWTNIDFDNFPTEITPLALKDILEENADEKYFFDRTEINDFVSKTSTNKNASKDGLIKVFDLPKDVWNDHERQRRVFSIEGKSPTVLARADTTKILIDNKVRKLTPLECERLQGVPDNYTSICSDAQRYKMVGNGFTVNVIEHFLKGINKKPLEITANRKIVEQEKAKKTESIEKVEQLQLFA
jgi:DNA-cytosine methyltransferase